MPGGGAALGGASAPSEGALVAFTLLVAAAWGTVLAALALGGAGNPACAGCAAAMATAGMAASVFHLAKPLRAPFSLRNLASSWLSREILAVSCFWALLAAWLAAAAWGVAAAALAAALASFAGGGVLMAIVSKAYRVAARPAWAGPEGLLELCGMAAGTGPAVAMACLAADGATWMPLAAAGLMAAGLALDVAAHRMRRARLASDEGFGAEPTRKNYRRLWGRVRRCWAVGGVLLAGAAVVAAASAFGLFAGSGPLPAFPWAALAAGELAVHARLRSVFYELPAQGRYVARLKR